MSTHLYSVSMIREMEKQCYAEGISPYTLMCQAGAAAFQQLRLHWRSAKSIAVLIGKGNNGGDGLVLARLAQLAGLDVTVYALYDENDLSDLSQKALAEANGVFVPILPFEKRFEKAVDLWVDAILGIGFEGTLSEDLAEAIHCLNQQSAPVLSIDVPSGLQADSGVVNSLAVCATKTVTFIGNKRGLYTADAKDHTGEILLETLGSQQKHSVWQRLGDLADPRRPRRHNSHKGDHGRVLIIGGSADMGGAILLCGQAALAMGAGLVKVCCDEKHHPAVISRQAELMTGHYGDLDELLLGCDLIVVGPGLDHSAVSEKIVQTVFDSEKPCIVDAGALWFLSKQKKYSDHWILTPHPGEAATLLDTDPQSISSDRWLSASRLQAQYGGTVILKGSGTIIQDDQNGFVCECGNGYMAQAGQGDVLAGIIAGLVAQKVSLIDASKFAVYYHALIGDRIFERKQDVVHASDVISAMMMHSMAVTK